MPAGERTVWWSEAETRSGAIMGVHVRDDDSLGGRGDAMEGKAGLMADWM